MTFTLARDDLFSRDHPADTTEVVDMTMGVDDRDNWLFRAMLIIEFKACLRGRDRRGGVYDDQPGITLDDGEVRDVDAPELIDALGDLEQATVAVELDHAPEAGIHPIWRGGIFRNLELASVEHHFSVSILDNAIRQSCDEAALGKLEIISIAKGQCFQNLLVRSLRKIRGGFDPGFLSECSPGPGCCQNTSRGCECGYCRSGEKATSLHDRSPFSARQLPCGKLVRFIENGNR
jgi:hypothetical protein